MPSEVSRGKVQLCVCVRDCCGGVCGGSWPRALSPQQPGLCGPRTVCAHHDTLAGWLHKPDTLPGASLLLTLPSPLLLLEAVRQIVLPVELAFSFSVGCL